MLIPKIVHPSWDPFFTDEALYELDQIQKNIGSNYNPTDPKHILRFLSVDLTKVKVIWLGQDVYPAKGVATGRSFEVGGLQDWNMPFRQVSLKNIVRLLHKTYHGISEYKDVKSFQEIQQEIKSGKFPIKHPPAWFNSLEQQGVLFLNTSFTCEVAKPNSHKEIWEQFSRKVIMYISTVMPDVAWFLWGKEAISNKKYIQSGMFFESRHPMMCSIKYADDFLKNDCFYATKNKINWLG